MVERCRRRRNQHTLGQHVLDILVHLRARKVDQEITGIVAPESDPPILAHLLLDLLLDRIEDPAVGLRDHDRARHRSDKRHRDLNAE